MLLNTIIRYVAAIIILGLMLFLPAGTLHYWQAWVFMVIFFAPMMFIALYLIKRDPELLKRRLQTKEKTVTQTVLSKSFYISLYLVLIVSGFDKRFHWSTIPFVIVIISDVLFLVGYYFLFLVFKKNKYLAHTVTVEKDQEIVTTGTYAVVRHPMYASELIMFIFAPLALGSYWALSANILLVAVLAIRIITEERLLLRELKGYSDYAQKTKYRLVPYIW